MKIRVTIDIKASDVGEAHDILKKALGSVINVYEVVSVKKIEER